MSLLVVGSVELACYTDSIPVPSTALLQTLMGSRDYRQPKGRLPTRGKAQRALVSTTNSELDMELTHPAQYAVEVKWWSNRGGVRDGVCLATIRE